MHNNLVGNAGTNGQPNPSGAGGFLNQSYEYPNTGGGGIAGSHNIPVNQSMALGNTNSGFNYLISSGGV